MFDFQNVFNVWIYCNASIPPWHVTKKLQTVSPFHENYLTDTTQSLEETQNQRNSWLKFPRKIKHCSWYAQVSKLKCIYIAEDKR